MKAKVRTFNGTTSPEVTQRETDHRKLAREAAAEGFVLLENKDHFLPLAKGSKVGLYGAGAIRTIKGGTGSGDVNERDSVNIFQGMKNAGYDVTSSEWLEDYDKLYVQARLDWKNEIFTKLNGDDTKFFDAYSATPFFMPSGNPIDEEKAAADGADTAFFVLARIAGENKDRFDTEGDYFISKEEKAILAQVSRCYKNVVLVINTGGLMDLAFVEEFDNIRSILQYVQAGQEGGNAFADVVSGDVTPSGKMTDTWAKDYYDYPGAEVYSYKSGDLMKEKYEEGIFVGYRYFDTFEVPVRYSFGYGMSYTDFEIRTDDIKVSGRGMMNPKVSVTVTVTNTGDTYAGKEVVQIYASCPQGRLVKEFRRLAGFGKTKLLAPKESQTMTITFPLYQLTSYEEESASWILEPGMYGIWIGNDLNTSVLSGALELACAGDAAAREFFAARGESGRIAAIEKAAAEERGRLSREGVRAIYGQKLYLTASRIDNFASCRFQFFLRYGLCAKPRQSAQFAPPERGTFLHFLLENVAREVSERGGFAETDDKTVAALTDKYVREYVRTQLEDFREKSPRFVYLFRRLAETSRRIVLDTAQELRRSDFRPLDFELNFSNKDNADLPPVSVGSGEDEFVLTGTADRVDGWEHGGKLYIRIVDYKSGKKKFALSDVWQGMGLQMLLYLFTLEKHGAERYGKEIVPAGVLYVPAHDILVRADKRLSDEEIVAEKARKLHRSGLILSETEVIEAMEHGEALQFLPLYRGKLAAEALATAEQLGKLSRFLEKTLSNMAGELRGGSIAADPWYENDRANTCRTCDYCDACRFSETADGWRFKTKFKAPEFWEKLENGEEETACP